jgi:hypothetical protein
MAGATGGHERLLLNLFAPCSTQLTSLPSLTAAGQTPRTEGEMLLASKGEVRAQATRVKRLLQIKIGNGQVTCRESKKSSAKQMLHNLCQHPSLCQWSSAVLE